MKAHLLHPRHDAPWREISRAVAQREARRTGWRYRTEGNVSEAPPIWNETDLTRDLALETLFQAMAGEDDCLYETVRWTILQSTRGDLEAVQYRQGVLQDCLDHSDIVRQLYDVALAAANRRNERISGLLARHPDWVLRDGCDRMERFLSALRALRAIADRRGTGFISEGWRRFFAMVDSQLDDGYLASVQEHLEQLRNRDGALVQSVKLGYGNAGESYILHRFPSRLRNWRSWFEDLFVRAAPAFAFELDPRDESGSQALHDLHNQGIALVADALGRSADHVGAFFGMLRVELAFYVGCLNLHDLLQQKNLPVCMPVAEPVGSRRLSLRGLYDVGLALTLASGVVGNDAVADDKALIIVTGANTGGKSTFLRSVGLAQVMMQSGMFVGAEAFHAGLCDGLFTHCKREEDTGLKQGKFDEELNRMSAIIDHIRPESWVLFNESFSATNEREGAEIAHQIMTALLAKGVRILCVTHLYELAHGFFERDRDEALFLRAPRREDGGRTFKLVEGEPLPTSFGNDLYLRIFSASHETVEAIGEREGHGDG
ncbi:endonuclease MutS2 [mine drainage metagenome]|uniref:Endonuclease MutS2 n=1 Tax=mine drainage metagenome TaxID=410659 RepID=A0A1J5R581_9ZZZZ